MTIRRAIAVAVVAASVLLLPVPARADITGFIGTMIQPSTQPLVGVAVGGSILIVGFEFEYAKASEDTLALKPSLATGTGNVLVQTPIGRVQFYGTAGAGVYHETLGLVSNTKTTVNVGGGVKIGLAGPLRLRLDYRVMTLNGSLRASGTTLQRFYAGINLKF